MRSWAYFSVVLLALVALAGFGLPRPVPSDARAAPPPARAEDALGAQTGPASTLEPIRRPVPPAPLRVALQAGHWKAQEAPNELRGLRNNGGTRGGGKMEWEVNLEIARIAASLFEEAGYTVDVLPATVPQAYRADAFVAIHADGSTDRSVDGYRVGWPRRDATRRAAELAEVLAEAYGEATGLRRLPVATRRMRGYYAFRYNRYRHAIHPTTVGVIIETGFLTNAGDREVIVDDQGRAARGIFDGVTRFLGPATISPETPAAGADR